MHTKFWSDNLKARDPLTDLGVDGNIKLDLREVVWERVR
jgi:hypothetical protein